MGNVVEMVENRIQNASMAAQDDSITQRIDLPVTSKVALSEWGASSGTTTSKRGKM